MIRLSHIQLWLVSSLPSLAGPDNTEGRWSLIMTLWWCQRLYRPSSSHIKKNKASTTRNPNFIALASIAQLPNDSGFYRYETGRASITEGCCTIAKHPMIGIVLSALHACFSAVNLRFCGMTTQGTRRSNKITRSAFCIHSESTLRNILCIQTHFELY
jgi:hypothetical protein